MALPVFDTLDLDEVIAAYGNRNQVNFPAVAFFDFLPEPAAVWAGEFPLVAGGVTWQGINRAVAISGLEEAAQGEADEMSFTLSGIEDDVLALLTGEDEANYVGRMVMVCGCFCASDWSPLAVPLALKAGIMGRMSISRTRSETGWMRTVTLPATNIFSGRNIAPASYWTPRDQTQRYPGTPDTGLDAVAGLQDRVLTVPWRG